jgi:predicted ABC-type ATPase
MTPNKTQVAHKNVLILRGASGCGKSSFADFIKNGWWNPHDVAICCADDYHMFDGEYNFDPANLGMAHSECRTEFNSYVDLDYRVIIVANTNTKPKEFEFYENLAKERGYNVTHIVIENRHGSNDVHDVPDKSKDRQKQNIKNSLTL